MNRQWTTWNSARLGWRKSLYGEIFRSYIPLTALLAALAFIAYGLGPLFVLLYTLRSGKGRRFSTLLAGITLVAQIDAKRCFDREYELILPWSLTAPAGWGACGILALGMARLLLSWRRAD